MRGLVLLAAALASAPAPAGDLTAHGEPLPLEARAIRIAPDRLAEGVSLAGAWQLTARHPDFGGLSGLLVEGERLTAITDRGAWITARLDRQAEPPLSAARIAPMLGPGGRPVTGRARDAESLARAGGVLHVAFEGAHRIMRHTGGGRLVDPARLPGFAALGGNSGVEGLAALPGGGISAIAEGRRDGAFPMWHIGPRGAVEGRLPARSKHDVTAADIGPDGRLYLLRRHWSPAAGVSIRLDAYALGPDALPRPESAEELAAFGPLSGIDNMEGLAVAPGPGGALTLWLVSDDNFNPPQRTILVALSLGP